MKDFEDHTTSEYSLNKSSGKASIKNKSAFYAILPLLPDKQNVYLSLALTGKSSKEIARLMKLKSDSSVRVTLRRAIINAKKRFEGV